MGDEKPGPFGGGGASKSLARRRHLPNQAKVRSTAQRLGKGWKPLIPAAALQSRLSTARKWESASTS